LYVIKKFEDKKNFQHKASAANLLELSRLFQDERQSSLIAAIKELYKTNGNFKILPQPIYSAIKDCKELKDVHSLSAICLKQSLIDSNKFDNYFQKIYLKKK